MYNYLFKSKENTAAATKLFTPDWIVRYTVENSLGRLWADGHADTSARSEWKYYLDEAEQTPEVQAQLAEIRAGRKDIRSWVAQEKEEFYEIECTRNH